MAQFARPDTDVSKTNWTGVGDTTNLYENVNEVSASDSDYNTSSTDEAILEFNLTSVTDPENHASHVVRWRWQVSGGGGPKESGSVFLYEGGTLRATCADQATLPDSWTSDSYTLTTGEASNISDYSDLRIRFQVKAIGGGESMQVSWAELEVPEYVAPVAVNVTDSATVSDSVSLSLDAPTITITTDGHLQESSGPQYGGPLQDPNGNLYMCIREDTTSTDIHMYKSTDGGASWAEQDSAGAPTHTEGQAGYYAQLNNAGDEIHVVTVKYDESVRHSIYYTSSHTTPDEWEATPMTLVATYTDTGFESGMSLAFDANDDIIIFSAGENTDTTEQVDFHYSQNNGDTWNTKNQLCDRSVTYDNTFAGCVTGKNGKIHCLWRRDDTNYGLHRSFATVDATPSTGEDYIGDTYTTHSNNYLFSRPLTYYEDSSGNEWIGHFALDTNQDMWAVWIQNDGTPGTPTKISDTAVHLAQANDHNGPMGAVVFNKKVYLFFIEDTGKTIKIITNDDQGGWTGEATVKTGTNEMIHVGYFEYNDTAYAGIAYMPGTDTSTTVNFMTYEIGPVNREVDVSDSATLSDSVSVELGAGVADVDVSVTDAITASDSVSLLLTELYLSASDAISTGESQALLLPDLLLSVTDGISAADTVSVEFPAPSVIVSDAISTGDSVSLLVGAVRPSVADAISTADAVTMNLVLHPSASEAISVSDSVAAHIWLSPGVSDKALLSDGVPFYGKLVEWFELNEASGNRVGAHLGTVLSDQGSTGSVTGVLGNATEHTAAFEYLLNTSPPDGLLPSGNDKAIFLFVKFPNTSGGPILGLGRWDGWIDIVKVPGINVTFDVNAVTETKTGLSTDTWYWLACWYDDSASTIYFSLDNAAATSSGSASAPDNPGYVTVGEEAAEPEENVGNVIVDMVVIFDDYIPGSSERTYLFNSAGGRTYLEYAQTYSSALLAMGAVSVNISESISVADSVSLGLDQLSLSVSDAIAVADSVSLEVGALEPLAISVSDAISAADSVSMHLESNLSVSDAITAADSVTASLGDLPASVSDAISAVDAVAVDLAEADDLSASVSDAISAADSVATHIWLSPSVSDAISAADAVSLLLPDLQLSVSDAISVADSVAGSLPGQGAYASDALSVGDTVSLALSDLDVSVTDAASVSAAPAVRSPIGLPASDSISVADSVALQLSMAASVSDATPAADSISASLALPCAISDAVSVADSVGAYVTGLSVSVSDNCPCSDSVAVDIGNENWYANVADAVSLGESVSLLLNPLSASASDSVSAGETADAAVEDPLIGATDTVALSDSVVIYLPLTVSVADALAASDSVGWLLPDLKIAVAHALTLGENVDRDLGYRSVIASDSISVAEVIGVLVYNVPIGRVYYVQQEARVMHVRSDVRTLAVRQ